MILHEFDELGSTNDMARQLLENGNSAPFWVIANKQTSGRGRRGKIWYSIAGNLFASGIYKFENNLKVLPILSFVMAIALKRSFEKYVNNSRIALKWPNDIYIDEKKISGILLEHLTYNNKSHIIFGIGINLVSSPLNIDQDTINLFSCIENGENLPLKNEFLNEIIANFENLIEEFNKNGFENIRIEWLNNAYKLGCNIKANIGTNEIFGIFETINENGELLIRDSENIIHSINSGDVFFQHNT